MKPLGGSQWILRHCGPQRRAVTVQGLVVAGLAPLPRPLAGDFVFVPGYPVRAQASPAVLLPWLRACAAAGARVISICTGAFVLARAGLLDGRRCTTHWRRASELQAACPRAKVLADRLFVEDGRISTSAGVAAGIDLTLDLIEQLDGPLVASRVARELVVHQRRGGSQGQESVYRQYRSHAHPGVHHVQDHLLAHPGEHLRLPELARAAGMSVRSLTRAFVAETGVSVAAYRRAVRLEHARMLLTDRTVTVEQAAAEAGFADPRQLRRLWHERYGESPSRSRATAR